MLRGFQSVNLQYFLETFLTNKKEIFQLTACIMEEQGIKS